LNNFKENNTSRWHIVSVPKNIHVFCLLWLVTLIIYFPAAKAGWVREAVGWINDMKNQNFLDFINRAKVTTLQGFYQLYAIHYFVFYKLWGLNVWLWSLLFITTHATNAFLLFTLSKRIFTDSGIQKGALISLCGVLIYAVCPHVSEVVVWKACAHYMMGFLFILLILLLLQKYQHKQQSKYAWCAAFIFFLSSFSLEIFYLTPFLSLTLALYYRLALGYDKAVFRKTILYFCLPQILLFALYFIALYATYKYIDPHTTTYSLPLVNYISKPAKYVFHILLFGRYFSMQTKGKVYGLCESVVFLISFYGIMVTIGIYGLVRLRKLSAESKAMFLLFTWAMMFLGFLLAVDFPLNLNFYVVCDRYTYFADGIIYILMALIIARYVNKYVAVLIFIIYASVNLYFTAKVNTYWKQSTYVDNKLMRDFPDPGDKTVVLLNIPENMNGIPMMGAQPEGEFKVMHNILAAPPYKNTIYDVASYNMLTKDDGAHARVINDSTIDVILNQWGTWWWYAGFGAKSYENKDYRLQMNDMGHNYELRLKYPANKYMVLIQNGDQWKVVDMNKKNEDQ